MSTQKGRIKDPKKARRRKESIIAEAIISKACGWRIEFLSGGYDSYAMDELVKLAALVHKATGQKQWLNIGALTKEEMKSFLPHIKGICGAIECINPKVRKEVCPSKPTLPIVRMLQDAEKLGLKKSITIIIGLGETEKDIPLLTNFIRKYRIDRVTFYALNPHKGTPFTQGPKTEYYVKWIRAARQGFPKLEIVAGSWVNRLSEIHLLLEAGADSITKFPAIQLFNSRYARQIEQEAKKAGRKFEGTMTKLPKIDVDKELSRLKIDEDLKGKIKHKVKDYVNSMKKR